MRAIYGGDVSALDGNPEAARALQDVFAAREWGFTPQVTDSIDSRRFELMLMVTNIQGKKAEADSKLKEWKAKQR